MWRYVIWAGPHRPLFGRLESRIPAAFWVSVLVSYAGYVSIMLWPWYISCIVKNWCSPCVMLAAAPVMLMMQAIVQLNLSIAWTECTPDALTLLFFSLSIASWAELTGEPGLLCWFTWWPWFVHPRSMLYRSQNENIAAWSAWLRCMAVSLW